jgi:hypothetical protein
LDQDAKFPTCGEWGLVRACISRGSLSCSLPQAKKVEVDIEKMEQILCLKHKVEPSHGPPSHASPWCGSRISHSQTMNGTPPLMGTTLFPLCSRTIAHYFWRLQMDIEDRLLSDLKTFGPRCQVSKMWWMELGPSMSLTWSLVVFSPTS